MKKKYIRPVSKTVMVYTEGILADLQSGVDTFEILGPAGENDVTAKDEKHWIGDDLDVSDEGNLSGWHFSKPETWFDED